MNHDNKYGIAVVLALVALVGLVVGAAIAYPIGNDRGKNNNVSSDNQSSNQSAASKSDGVTVGGAKMVNDKDIVDNAINAKNVTTLVAAVKSAGLVEMLKGEDPFTVFMPNNDAFAKLPAGTVDTLLLPENVEQLQEILTYHVVAGTYTGADLKAMANKGETLTSVQGGILSPVIENGRVKLKDAKGIVIGVETADVISSNGVTHIIDTVLMHQ